MKFTGLRFKLMTALAVSLLLLLVVQFIVAQSLLLQGYSKLESDKTIFQINNAKRVFDLQGQQLEGLAKDWAHWDDTYQYMATPTKAYIETNYNNTVITNIKIDAIFLVNTDGQIVYQMSHDIRNDKPWPIPHTLTLAVSNDGAFTKPPKTGSITRLFWSSEGLMMVSASNILPTLLNADRRGTLIMVRLINLKVLQELETIVGAKVNVTSLDADSNANDDLKQIVKQFTPQNKWVVHPLNKSEVAGYTLLDSDINHPLLLSTVSDRKIFEQRQNNLSFILWSTGGIVLLLLVLSWFFDKLLITPLTKLSKNLSVIDASPDCMVQLPVLSSNDELANLTQCINNMLTNLDKRQKALQESEFLWKFAIEGSGDGVWDWNILTDEAHYSKYWKEMLGYSDKDILPTNDEWASRVHPDDQLYVKNTMQAYLEGKTEIYVVKYRLRCKDDSYKWILGRGMIVSRSEDGKPLRMIGTHTDISEHKHLELELTRQAHLDYLTGLSNRRHFMAQGEVELSRAIRYDTPLSLLMLDIDFFKNVNDTYGHQVGDIVLQVLSKVCQGTMRQVDIAGRLGGEEFAVILPETEAKEALEVAERLREAIAKTEVMIPAGLPIHFTVSIGVTTLNDKDANIDVLLNQADKALYEAKETGRNKVCVR